MEKPRITVVGSANADVVLSIEKYPACGETVRAFKQYVFPGGKGANQAVACARLGGEARFIGAVGRDAHGEMLKKSLETSGVDIRGLAELDTQATGTAYILVDTEGRNTIIVSMGANDSLSAEHIGTCEDLFSHTEAVILQLEIPLDAAERAAERARCYNIPCTVNLAPPKELAENSPLWKADTIIVNEHEAFFYTGIYPQSEKEAKDAADYFFAQGCGKVIITLGEKGAYGGNKNEWIYTPVRKLEVVDTTAAGDTFVGAYTVEYARTGNFAGCMKYASAAAGIAVTRMGAQTSIPNEEEVRTIMKEERKP